MWQHLSWTARTCACGALPFTLLPFSPFPSPLIPPPLPSCAVNGALCRRGRIADDPSGASRVLQHKMRGASSLAFVSAAPRTCPVKLPRLSTDMRVAKRVASTPCEPFCCQVVGRCSPITWKRWAVPTSGREVGREGREGEGAPAHLRAYPGREDHHRHEGNLQGAGNRRRHSQGCQDLRGTDGAAA